VHIGDDPRIFEVNESVVNKKMTSRRGVEYVEVSVLDPNTIEVGRGEGLSVERGRIFATAFASHTYKVSILVDTLVANVLGSFSKSFLVEKDNGVEMGLGSIIMYPPFSGMVRVLEVTSKRGG